MSLNGTTWVPIGPSPIQGAREDNGLISAIAVNPNNSSVIYIGTAGGGVWRSSDAGVTWTPTFDRQLSLAIGEPGALAIDPTNTDTLYVGTSGRLIFRTFSQNTGTFSLVQAGLFKSTDGGASWIRLGSGYPSGNTGNANQFAGRASNVLIVDPANSQIVYLACDAGVYRSVDGGRNWTLGVNAAGDALSLVLDTSSPAASRILYAGITGQGVIRSTDGGQNWTQVLSGATPVLANALCPIPPCTPARGFGRFSVALAPPVSPPNPAGVQVLYATMEGTPVNSPPVATDAPNPVGFFMSTDQGATWTRRTAPGGLPPVTYGGYCLHIAVDPASPGDGSTDTIYFGNKDQAVSTDSGLNFTVFTGATSPHSDTHAWGFIPQPGSGFSTVLCGTDGGLSRSTDRGATWTTLNAGGFQSTLFYNIDIRPDATASVTVGALQDNALETTSGGTGLGWRAGGGDGFDIAYDATIAGQVYGCSNSGTAPLTRISRSTNDGVSFPTDITPWGTTTDQGIYLAPVATDPSTGGIVYALGNQNLWQSRDGGATPPTWRIILPGLAGGGNHIDVARANGNNVVVAVGNQVFVSTNALAATGVTFANIPGLPTRNVARAVFDPTDPTVIYAILGGLDGGGSGNGHVFRTTIGATSWTDISPPLDIPFSALALDGSDTPSTIYVGTEFGVLRSVNGGALWSILDDIHLPRVPVLDLALRNGILRAGTYGRGVFAFAKAAGPSVAVSLEHGLAFGTVCQGPQYLTLEIFNVGAQDLVITSVQRLMGSTSFSVLSTPGTPLVVARGEHIDFTVVYNPTAAGIAETATIRIISNDPAAPVVDLSATGIGGAASLETIIADSGDFGNVCLGSFVDRGLVINNRGPCPLRVTGVTSSSADFIPPRVSFFPLVVAAGNSVELPIRFQPNHLGAASATLTITSNDPSSPETVRVTGNTPAPRLALSIANAGNFGDVCVGSFRDEPVTLSNSAGCPLTVTGIVSSSPEFIPPGVHAYPFVIAAGDSLDVEVRFQPTSFGSKSATLTVSSDDPSGPRMLALSGFTPSGKLAVTGTGHFGPVDFGRRAERTISICNVGKCDLRVLKVAFLPDPWKPGCHDCDGCGCGCGCGQGHHQSHEHAHDQEDKHEHGHHHKDDSDQCCATFKIVSNPFPATVRPGSCLPVLIRFTPTCAGPKCCEIVIETDDPDTPKQIVYVTGSMHRTLRSALKCWAAEELQSLLKAGKHS